MDELIKILHNHLYGTKIRLKLFIVIQHACVITSLQDEKSIKRFFPMLISVEMVYKIANFTNNKISLINNNGLDISY